MIIHTALELKCPQSTLLLEIYIKIQVQGFIILGIAPLTSKGATFAPELWTSWKTSKRQSQMTVIHSKTFY